MNSKTKPLRNITGKILMDKAPSKELPFSPDIQIRAAAKAGRLYKKDGTVPALDME